MESIVKQCKEIEFVHTVDHVWWIMCDKLLCYNIKISIIEKINLIYNPNYSRYIIGICRSQKTID